MSTAACSDPLHDPFISKRTGFALLRSLATIFLMSGFVCSAQQGGAQDPRQALPAALQQTQQPSDAEAPSFTFKVVASIVTVDVVVRDKEDNPVRDLSIGDLQVSEKIGDLPFIPQKIASFELVKDAAAQRLTRSNGIVLGWLHKSFCPLDGAYELSYYLSSESRKDGLHRLSVTASRPGLRLFFRPAYKIEADKPAEVSAAELGDQRSADELQKQQLLEAERNKHPELALALVACYDTLSVTSFPLQVRTVESKASVDTFEFLVPGSYFASLPAEKRNHPLQLDFSLCIFEAAGHPIRHYEGTVRAETNSTDDQSLATQGFTHAITVERIGCRMQDNRLVCNPPISQMPQGSAFQIVRSARLVVRDRDTGALGSGEIVLGDLPPDQFPAPIPEGVTNDSFGIPNPTTPLAMCGDVYQLAPWTPSLPLFSELDAVAPTYATSLGVHSRFFTVGIPGATSRTEWFGVNYQGRFGVDQPGKYEFDLLSDDGGKVYIDDRLVVSDDAIHQDQRSRGKVQLDAGPHNIRVSYFQGPRIAASLVFLVKPPGHPWRLFDTRDFPNPDEPGLQRKKLPVPGQ